jgi:thiol:disulfide interchange protein DsbD
MVRSTARSCVAAALALLALGAGTVGADDPKLLPNDRAFAFSARGVDERTVEARFVIADGYYLYRDKLRFTAEPAVALPALPPGKIKEDQFFGKVETYRNQIVVTLPLEAAAPGKPVTVHAESQGCADLGVCYPPQVQNVTLTLPLAGGRPGMPVEAPQKKSWLQ